MNFLNDLNPSQRNSVEYTDGPLMVIAGAGSGKTRVLTYKIAYLIQKGWTPYNILALTFTNKAANEMKERIAHLINPAYSKQIWAGTFHSVFAKILRKEADHLNYSSNFTIYDTSDSKSIITDILKKMQLHNNKNYSADNIFSKISMLKNNLISYATYETMHQELARDKHKGIEYFIDIYKAYQQQLYKNSAMDFDDLLYYTNVLFRDFPNTLKKYQNLFQYVLVDEFQDTNAAQYFAVKQLSHIHKNICVVGDDAQSIYGFRGADINNIVTHFKNDFPSYKEFKLEENYRSTKYIVEASNAIIKNNKKQIPKQIYTNNHQGEPITLYEAINENHEAQIIAKEISSLKNNHNVSYSDIAILYRTNAQSRSFEDVFRSYNIPYKIWGGMSFYQRKEIKEVLAYFRVVINPNDEEALIRIINFPSRGIGDTTIEKLKTYADENQTSVFNILQNIKTIQNELNISDRQVNTIHQFVTSIQKYQASLYEQDVFTLANEIIKFSGIINYYESSPTETEKERSLNIKELLNAIQQFSQTERTSSEETAFTESIPPYRTLEEFMREVSLLTSQDEKTAADNSPKITLMTIHLSKGLEFPYIFICGLEEKLFPYYRAFTPEDIEEERRLFYVALTRAKKKVYLSYAKSRFINGKTNFSTPSRFIDELPQKFLNTASMQIPYNKNNYTHTTQKNTSTDKEINYPKKLISLKNTINKETDANMLANKNLQIGDKIYHDKFQKGIILDISGNWPDSKAVIDFEKYGKKILLLKFAILKKI